MTGKCGNTPTYTVIGSGAVLKTVGLRVLPVRLGQSAPVWEGDTRELGVAIRLER